MQKVLIGCPVYQGSHVLDQYLKALDSLDMTDLQVDLLLVDNSDDSRFFRELKERKLECIKDFKVKRIEAGYEMSLLLDNKGNVYCFGKNGTNQLGLGHDNYINEPTLNPYVKNIISISSGNNHCLLLRADGLVYSFGLNGFGQLGLGDNVRRKVPTLIAEIRDIIQISAGNHISLLLDKSGKIYSFGRNDSGQLGLGDNIDRNVPTMVGE